MLRCPHTQHTPTSACTCPLPSAPPAGMADGFLTVLRTEGVLALYKGLVPTLVGIAPYAGGWRRAVR